MNITDFLTEGRESARTARELCDMTGLKPREFFATIEAARRKGAPICAAKGDNPGYYLAADREELQEYIAKLTRQEKTTKKTRIACAHSLDNLEDKRRPRAAGYRRHQAR